MHSFTSSLHHCVFATKEREPWLAIDPKPYVGDPTYDPLQHMLNFPGRLAADPGGFARRMAELLDLARRHAWCEHFDGPKENLAQAAAAGTVAAGGPGVARRVVLAGLPARAMDLLVSFPGGMTRRQLSGDRDQRLVLKW